MYKLDEEQIIEIIEDYECSRNIINKIEYKLNMSGKVKSEEDYFELACSVASQYSSIRQIVSNQDNIRDIIRKYMSLDEIVYSELNRKYELDEKDEFFDIDEQDVLSNEEKNYKLNKKRHF